MCWAFIVRFSLYSVKYEALSGILWIFPSVLFVFPVKHGTFRFSVDENHIFGDIPCALDCVQHVGNNGVEQQRKQS